MVTDICDEVMPNSSKEKGENRSRIIKENRTFRIINGTDASTADKRFLGSRSCIQFFAISSECLSGFIEGILVLNRIIPVSFYVNLSTLKVYLILT
jgi:hypothetical protein